MEPRTFSGCLLMFQCSIIKVNRKLQQWPPKNRIFEDSNYSVIQVGVTALDEETQLMFLRSMGGNYIRDSGRSNCRCSLFPINKIKTSNFSYPLLFICMCLFVYANNFFFSLIKNNYIKVIVG